MSYPIGPETPNDFRGIGNITGLQDVNPPGGGGLIRNAAELVRGNFFLNILGGFLNLGQALGSLLGELADAFGGDYAGDDHNLRRIQDGQRDLNGRIDLVEDISGLCVLTQYQTEVFSNNWSASWPRYFNWGSSPIGPDKHARWEQHYSPTRGRWVDGILLEEAGTWEIAAQVTSKGIFTVGGWASMVWEIAIIDLQTDGLRSQKMGYNEVVQWHRTYNLNHTFIAEEGGRYLVLVAVRHSRNGAVSFPHGDNFTHLKVSRWDLRTDGPPSPPPSAPLPLD